MVLPYSKSGFNIIGRFLDVEYWVRSKKPCSLLTMFCRNPCRKGYCVQVAVSVGEVSRAPHPPAFMCWCGTHVGALLHYGWENSASEERVCGCGFCRVWEELIFTFQGKWMPRGGRHMEKWVLSLGSSQGLSGPLGLAGNVLIVLLGRVPWWPPAKDPVINEGVAQLFGRALVSVVLLVKGEPSSRLDLLSFSLRFSLNIGSTLGKAWLPQTTSPPSLGLFPLTSSPGSQNARNAWSIQPSQTHALCPCSSRTTAHSI